MKSKRMAEAHKNLSSLSTQRTEPPVSKNIFQSDEFSEGAVLGNAGPSFEILLLTKGFLVAFLFSHSFAQKRLSHVFLGTGLLLGYQKHGPGFTPPLVPLKPCHWLST